MLLTTNSTLLMHLVKVHGNQFVSDSNEDTYVKISVRRSVAYRGFQLESFPPVPGSYRVTVHWNILRRDFGMLSSLVLLIPQIVVAKSFRSSLSLVTLLLLIHVVRWPRNFMSASTFTNLNITHCAV